MKSLALRDIPRPDYADVQFCPLPVNAPADPAFWAREVFDLRRGPRWILALILARQAAVRLIGLDGSPPDTFRVREQAGEEVLIAADESHLDFRVGVGVDAGTGLLRVLTAVRFNNLTGRLYFGPVRLLHPVVVRSMVRAAVRRNAVTPTSAGPSPT